MKKTDWPAIEEELKQLRVADRAPPADDFWREFRQRAGDVPRLDEAPRGRASILPWPRVALAAAGLAIIGLIWLFSIDPQRPAENPPRVATAPNHIQSLEVKAPYSAVFILEDEATDSTVVWISDLELTPTPEGHSL